MKRCRGECGGILPTTLEYFHAAGGVSKEGRPYLKSVCKVCFNKNGMPEKLPEGKKRCTECAKILPATLEYFKSQPQSPQAYRIPRIGAKRLFKDDGRPYLTSKCKSCINKLQSENYDPEKAKKRNDQYWDANKEELREKAAARRMRPGAKERAIDYQRGYRKTKRKEQTEALNALLRSQNIPEPNWGEDEYADEEKFEEKIEELIVQRYGVGIVRRKRCEKLFVEYGITRYPDTYIPELNLIVEAKLLSGMWKSPTKRKQFMPQVLDYQKVCDTVIVSLDGGPDWWETEEEITDVTWFDPLELLDFIDKLVFDKHYK
ncbi:hypothetical protein OAK38_04855 [Verrucomicrobia bacterium]|nr:hypothetical protein [Verrucomicrobiota bacterium]